jgi:Gpi18-like mannosyltransferase
MRAVSSVFGTSLVVAGVIISCVGGFFASILVQRLTTGWWGEASGRRAVVLFCAFPGAIVFSMVYSEGLLLPLAVGCILALERRRWLLAGVLAGIATAVEPDALALVVVCIVAAFLELRRRGIRDREALKSLLAPFLAPVGAAAFAAYLWAWTGTPFATYITQHTGWQEKTDLLAVYHNLQLLLSEIDLTHFNQPTINLNLVEGLIGVVVLIIGLVLLLRERRLISTAGLTWTLVISFLMVTSENVPPNPRLLITAFPLILVFAHRLQGKRYAWLIAGNVVLLIGLSALTYVGVTIRP